MNDDSRIERYLSDRADAITLEPANPAAVVKRGNRRRNQKRGGVLAAVAVLGVLGTSLVLQDPDGDQTVDSDTAASIVPSGLDWTVVQPEVGLGYGLTQATLADGSVYALSTAPGPMQGQQSYTQHLYRSADGSEWDAVELPTGQSISSLSASGDTLYAIGTAPAGGNARDVKVAASSDGGSTWNSVTLPDDVAELDRKYPGMISVGTPSIAAADATHQVAAITVSANLDPTKYRDDIPEDAGWQTSSTGVDIFEPMECTASPTTIVDAEGLSDEDRAKLEEEAAMAARGSCEKQGQPEVIASYTWDELGVPAELQSYIGGTTFAFVTEDGSSFDRVDVPVDAEGWSSSKVMRTADGYLLFVGSGTPNANSTTVLSSIDGRTWTQDSVVDGSFNNAGLLGDRAAVSIWTADGASKVLVQQPGGAWSSLDVTSAVEPPAGHDAWLGEVAFGPLGMAAIVTTSPRTGDAPAHSYLVHSTDGSTLSVLDLAEYLEGGSGYPAGVTVTADAITVRAVLNPDGNAATVEPTQVLVGTPR